MNDLELKIFIGKRKLERMVNSEVCTYIQSLFDENAISERLYKEILVCLNNRHYFLERSINDHEKMIKS